MIRDSCGPVRGRRVVPAFWILAISLVSSRTLADVRSETPSPLSSRTVSVAVEGGRATLSRPTRSSMDRTLVVVGALSRSAGPHPFRLQARSSPRATSPTPSNGSTLQTRFLPELLPDDEPAMVPGAAPPPVRTFHLMVRDGDAASAGNYVPITARLRQSGRGVHVFVDVRDSEIVDDAVVAEVVRTFDDAILPVSTQHWGCARDVDGDGHFTVLISRWPGRLGEGRLSVDGLVRAADFDLRLTPPFGNRCDMMYLRAGLEVGPHLRTILAHEYAHALTLSLKNAGIPGERREAGFLEEESWLDEAQAHVVEDVYGFSRTNLDNRVEAFLGHPERYGLVVEDYYFRDLFRSRGHRGSTYLFLRWCTDRYGEALIGRLMRSPRTGVENLEAVTGVRFEELFRAWSVALFLEGFGPGPPTHNRTPGPAITPGFDRIRPDGRTCAWSSEGTAPHYLIVDGSPEGSVEISVRGEADAEMQVTAVPLPRDYPLLSLAARPIGSSQGMRQVRLIVRNEGAERISLESLRWERRASGDSGGLAHAKPQTLSGESVVVLLGTGDLGPGEQRASGPLAIDRDDIAANDVTVVRLFASDPLGRRVSACVEIEPGPREVASSP